MNKSTKQLLAAAVVAVFSLPVSANVTFGDGGAQLQDVLNNITVTPAGASSVDVVTDQLVNDGLWSITANGGSVATVVIELAAFAPTNSFGVYDAATGLTVQLFSGANVQGDQVTLSIKADGSVFVNNVDSTVDFTGNMFGYYLDATVGNQNGNAIFYSQTAKNADGVDHLAAYQGEGDIVQLPGYLPGEWTDNEFVLAWEDQFGGGDTNYTNFVVMVESVKPVPAPFALGLLGFGLFGVGFASRRRQLVA